MATVYEVWRGKTVIYTIYVDNDVKKAQCAVLQAHYNDDERNVHVLDVCTYRGYAGRGYASLLLNILLEEIPRTDFDTVTLDDCSDLFQHPRNIYLRHGFRYINEGQPEMVYDLN